LRNLAELQLLPHNQYDPPDEFVEDFARRLLDITCCPVLQDLRINYELDEEARESIRELEKIRPSLYTYVEPEPESLGYEHEEDGIYGWENSDYDSEDYVTDSGLDDDSDSEDYVTNSDSG
ncbi:hypothetical protein FRC09_017457, partial [Ceratobasidium sp. 395]